MASIIVEFRWNRETEDLQEYLKRKDLRVVHKYRSLENVERLMPGMAIKHKSGAMVRVMSRLNNHENMSHDYVLAANSLNADKVMEYFWQW